MPPGNPRFVDEGISRPGSQGLPGISIAVELDAGQPIEVIRPGSPAGQPGQPLFQGGIDPLQRAQQVPDLPAQTAVGNLGPGRKKYIPR